MDKYWARNLTIEQRASVIGAIDEHAALKMSEVDIPEIRALGFMALSYYAHMDENGAYLAEHIKALNHAAESFRHAFHDLE